MGLKDVRQVVSEWESQIALANPATIPHGTKFGHNPDVGTSEETVWPLGGDYNWLASGTELEIICTDNTNGQGQTMRVIGIGSDGAWKEAYPVLTGQTPVSIGEFLVVHRVYQVSASPDPVGDVYIATTAATYTGGVPDDNSLVHAFLDFSDAAQQTEQTFVMVPKDHVALVYSFKGLMNASQGTNRSAQVVLEVAEPARGYDRDAPTWAPRRRVSSVALNSGAQITDLYEPKVPHVFSEFTRIEARASASASSDLRAEIAMIWVPVPGGQVANV